MPVWAWIVIGVGAVVVIALALFGADRRRSRQLEEKFGPEYGRTVRERGGRRAAESELREREHVRDRLEITPLSDRQRERYGREWERFSRTSSTIRPARWRMQIGSSPRSCASAAIR